MNAKRPKVLTLMSGGRDSLLAACISIEAGYEVYPFFCNNGHMEGCDRIFETIREIDERYGEMIEMNYIEAKTAMTLHEYMQAGWNTPISIMSQNYPGLRMGQLHCLACRTAMFTHAIACAKALEIENICDGVRHSQGFFVDQPSWIIKIIELCKENGIQLHIPVDSIESDLERKRKLCDRGMPTKTLEPQCFLGTPLDGKVQAIEAESLTNFYVNELLPKVKNDIIELVPIYRHSGVK